MDTSILVTKPLMPSLEDYTEKLRLIWEKQWMTNNGALCQQLQEKLKERMRAPYLELFTNGHLALDIVIKAYGLTGEVITTPFTFASTTHALTLNGIKPVFCDVHEENYTIDETKIENLITEQTTAILPVHVYGWPCNSEAIERIAKKHKLKVIYDAAHAFDVEVNGRPLVLEGDASMLSFHATKVFNTIEGGALVMHDPEIAQKTVRLRNFGIEDAERVPDVGLNAKMNEFASAMGLCNLEIVDTAIAHRKKLAERYCERLEKCRGIRMMNYALAERVGIKLNYAYMPIDVEERRNGKNRDRLFEELQRNNIFTRKYFYPLIQDYSCYRDEYDSRLTPIARRVSHCVLTLPISGTTTMEELDATCDVIERYTK